MISRRALFGLGAGAAAAAVVPAKALVVGMDFGMQPAMMCIRDGYVIWLSPKPPFYVDAAKLTHIETVDFAPRQ